MFMTQRNKLQLIRLWIHTQNKTVGKITDIALPDPVKSKIVSFVVFCHKAFMFLETSSPQVV